MLNGADRRPAVDFNVALAGTLTEITFTGGGKVLFDYEPHRFYDPVAQQSLPAGGLRIRTLRAQDPITKVETRRDFSYLENNGLASGTLLHMPRFAFAVPTLGPVQVWANATVRCGQDLGTDPFESRAIGYHQVVEKIPGKGQVVNVFDVSGAADETTVSPTTECVGWQRPLVGFARQSGSSGCPSVAPVQTGTELYPFAKVPGYDFRRGLPQRIQYLAEPVGVAAGALVRQQDFTYKFRYPQTTSQAVVGLAYEQTGNASDGTYVYAKYSLLTDFQYAISQEIVTVPNQTSTSSRSRTGYRYNDRGWLAATGSQNSDGGYVRTRYKYLTDYTLSSNSPDPLMQAMYQRLTATPEQISSDVVETISEVVTPAGDVRFKGATLRTFSTVQASTPIPALTRPYQVLQWEQLPPLPLSSTIDSTRLLNNALYVSPNFKPVSTVVEVDPLLRPISTRVVAGRQAGGQHLAYSGTLPVLQITNALASEVVFSDFETYKERCFSAYRNGGNVPATLGAARTGKFGMELLAGDYLLSPLPGSAAPRYRLAFWAKAGQATTVDDTFTGTPALAAQTVAVEGSGTWKLYELTFDWSTIAASARSGYAISLAPRNTIQVDDVALLPSFATSASTTYDLVVGKTSETDGRGRTTYYEYGPSDELATVRDHNKAIIRQYNQVVAGRYQSASASLIPSFSVSGSMIEGDELTFTVDNSLSFGSSFAWDFKDGATSTANPARHTFSLGDRIYRVELRVTNPQGKVYQTEQDVYVARKSFTITTCVAGIVAIDDCHQEPNRLSTVCNTAASNSSTTLSVQANLVGPYTYSWEIARGATWEAIPGANAASYVVTVPRSPYLYRCRVTAAGGYSGISEAFGIEHYQSTTCTP